MPAIIFAIVLLAGFLTCISIGIIYLKPACPKCGARSAVVFKKTKGRKKTNKTAYTCESCTRDFHVRGRQTVHTRAKLLLGAGALCLVLLLVNHVFSLIQADRTLAALKRSAGLRALIPEGDPPRSDLEPLYGDFKLAAYRRTTPRPRVEDFLDAHAQAKRISSSDDRTVYAFRYGWLPSYRLTLSFDRKDRYLDREQKYW